MFSRYSIITTIVISGMMSLIPLASALDVNQGSISSVETTCNDGAYATSNEIWYVGSTFYPREVHYGDTSYDYIYGVNSTKVDVYDPNGYLQINGGFQWYSQIKPKGVDEVVAFQNQNGSKLIGHPSTPDEVAAQLVYRLTRKYSLNYSGGPQGPFVYTPVGGSSQSFTYPSTPEWSADTKSGLNECVNIYARWCGDGILDTKYETCDPAAPGQSPTTCSPVTCQPITTTPTPVVSIKKYAKEISTSGDTQTAPIAVARGEAFNYYYQLQNTGSVAATGVVVKDTLPVYLTFSGAVTVRNPSNVDVSSDWTCVQGSQIFAPETISRITLVCSKKTDLPANSGVYTFTVPVVLAANAPVGVNMQNVVYVCADNVAANPTGPNGEVICGNNNPPPPPPPGQCDKTNPNSQKDPACIVVGGPNLSIRKYAKEISAVGDTQNAPISVARGEAFSYYYQLQNTGSVAATGVVVKDTLPSYLTFSGAITVRNPTGTDVTADWTCVQGSQIFAPETIARITLVCSKKTDLPANSGVYTFTVPVVLALTAPVGINMQNVVYVCADNVAANPTGPNGEVICGNINPPPPPPPGQCDKTNPNSQKDPACIVVPPPVCTVNCGGGSSTTYYIQSCINSINSCAAQSHGSLAICQAANPGKVCHTDINLCNTATALVCSGPGGPTPGGGGNPYGRCGDGVLQTGEECDVTNAPWCGQLGTVDACKVKLDTTPGANPITSMWIKIPALGGTTKSIGSNFIKKRLDADETNPDAYRIVVGKDTNVFTLADQVVFGVTTQYQMPIIVPVSKKMCLQAKGATVNDPKGICTTFGDASFATTSISGYDYVVLGAGSYQERLSDGTYRLVNITTPVYETILFRGSTPYTQLGETNVGPTLRDAFKGVGTSADLGSINLFGCSGTDCSPSAVTQMITIPVRISNMLVSSIGSASNRALELVLNPSNLFVGFLGTTSMNTSTTTSNNVGNVAINMPTIVGGAAGSASTVAELERYAVNGNRNILAVNGNLTIEGCLNNTFTMDGVRTVIVTGNLIIRCNIVYRSSDSISSWAWIAKDGGNIMIDNGNGTAAMKGITNLAGVYVATTGAFKPIDDKVTQAILRVEGTLYGNASPLFASRLYARATGAYDILTTGTILTYSNRALISPPPLLSQYLGTYQVQRVVQ